MNYLTAILEDSGQANLMQPIIVESNISEGRVNVSSITYWDSILNERKLFPNSIQRDYKFVRNEINLLRQQIGYDNLELNERILCNKYFASGCEYNNDDVTVEEQEAFYFDYKDNMNKCRLKRDISVTAYLFRLVKEGAISRNTIDTVIKDSQTYRDIYLRDGFEGIGYGNSQKGIINFVQDDLITYEGFTQSIVDKTLSIYLNGY